MAKYDQAIRRAKRAAALQRRLDRGAKKHAAKQKRATEPRRRWF